MKAYINAAIDTETAKAALWQFAKGTPAAAAVAICATEDADGEDVLVLEPLEREQCSVHYYTAVF